MYDPRHGGGGNLQLRAPVGDDRIRAGAADLRRRRGTPAVLFRVCHHRRTAAMGLLAVAEVARTRYYQPISPASLDPVVTGSRDRLRFESFSGCCGSTRGWTCCPLGSTATSSVTA